MASAFSSVGESASRSPGGAILPGNQRQAPRESENRTAPIGFAAITKLRDLMAFGGLLVDESLPSLEPVEGGGEAKDAREARSGSRGAPLLEPCPEALDDVE